MKNKVYSNGFTAKEIEGLNLLYGNGKELFPLPKTEQAFNQLRNGKNGKIVEQILSYFPTLILPIPTR